jgi:hypothetical protein
MPFIKKITKMMDMLSSLIKVIISQWIYTSKHHIVHIKYIFLLINHTSMKLAGKL